VRQALRAQQKTPPERGLSMICVLQLVPARLARRIGRRRGDPNVILDCEDRRFEHGHLSGQLPVLFGIDRALQDYCASLNARLDASEARSEVAAGVLIIKPTSIRGSYQAC
jgi:hypothetical protein